MQHFFRRRRRRVLVRGGAVVLRERTDAAGGDAGEERRVGSRRLRGSFHARVSVGNARGARVHARARAVPAVRERLRLPERGEDANLRRGLALLALKRRRRQREPRPRGLAVGGVDRRRLLHRADVDDRPSEAALAVHDWREEAGRERGGGGAVSRRTTGRRGGDDATTRERASATGRGEEMMPRAVASRRAPVSLSFAPCDCRTLICSASRRQTRDPPHVGEDDARAMPVVLSSASNDPITSNDESLGKCRPACTIALSSYTAGEDAATMAADPRVSRCDAGADTWVDDAYRRARGDCATARCRSRLCARRFFEFPAHNLDLRRRLFRAAGSRRQCRARAPRLTSNPAAEGSWALDLTNAAARTRRATTRRAWCRPNSKPRRQS